MPPPFQLGTSSLEQGVDRPDRHCSGRPSLAGTNMVATPSETVNSGATLLPSRPYLLQNPVNAHQVHPMYPRLHLGVFLVSSNFMKQRDFVKMLPTYSSQQLVPPHLRPTNLVGGVGAAGALLGKLIRFWLL